MDFSKVHILATLACAVALVNGAQAQATELRWKISIAAPLQAGAVQVHAQAAPRFAHPAPIWAPRPAVPMRRVYTRPTRWDMDGDGIPNRHDRLYNPRWDRDGDGIPNRVDRHQGRRWDRDRDGIPNRFDRYDDRRGWGR